MSAIYVNSIKDKTNTRVLASDNGSAWSLGSGLPPFGGACAGATSDQVISSETITKVTLDDVFVDTNSEFASSKFTASNAGTYQVSAQVMQNGESGTNVGWASYIYKNGSALFTGFQTTDYAVTYTFHVVSALVTLSVSDYLELYVRHNKGSNASINGTSLGGDGTYLTVIRIK